MSKGILHEVCWYLKYRPRTIDDMVMDDDRKAKFKRWIEAGDIPHVLLYGRTGTGKTTIARILVDNLDCDVLELNSSLDRGIDIVRDRVRGFTTMRSDKKLRVVLLEEADRLTGEAMDALRYPMERDTSRARFILTCNHVGRIVPAIRGRCQEFAFKALSDRDCARRLKTILTAENIKFDVDTLLQIVEMFYPDMRTMINVAQLSVENGELTKIKEDAADTITVLKLLKEGKIDEIRSIAYRLDFVDLMRYLFDNIAELGGTTVMQTERRLAIAEYLYRDYSIADQELNFMAMCLAITK